MSCFIPSRQSIFRRRIPWFSVPKPHCFHSDHCMCSVYKTGMGHGREDDKSSTTGRLFFCPAYTLHVQINAFIIILGNWLDPQSLEHDSWPDQSLDWLYLGYQQVHCVYCTTSACRYTLEASGFSPMLAYLDSDLTLGQLYVNESAWSAHYTILPGSTQNNGSLSSNASAMNLAD